MAFTKPAVQMKTYKVRRYILCTSSGHVLEVMSHIIHIKFNTCILVIEGFMHVDKQLCPASWRQVSNQVVIVSVSVLISDYLYLEETVLSVY